VHEKAKGYRKAGTIKHWRVLQLVKPINIVITVLLNICIKYDWDVQKVDVF
jgi:hypothetical protein